MRSSREVASKKKRAPPRSKRVARARAGPGAITRQAMPSFEPFVNRVAGPSALGVRVGFPADRTVDLNYCSYVNIANTSGIGNSYQWRLNSAFDPDYTGTGTQPLGFDQWSLFYNHYVVTSCDYQIQACPAASAYTPMHYAVHLSDDATVPNTIVDLTELGAQTAIQQAGTVAHIFSGRVSIPKFFNRSGDVSLDSELRAITGANPSDMVFLTFRCAPLDGSSTITTSAICKLTMRVKFMEPRDLGPSTFKLPKAGVVHDKEEEEYEYVRVKKVTA